MVCYLDPCAVLTRKDQYTFGTRRWSGQGHGIAEEVMLSCNLMWNEFVIMWLSIYENLYIFGYWVTYEP